jgi:hypothetical protein
MTSTPFLIRHRNRKVKEQSISFFDGRFYSNLTKKVMSVMSTVTNYFYYYLFVMINDKKCIDMTFDMTST